MDLEYDDLQPGVSPDEEAEGLNRGRQVVLGVFIVCVGIVLLPFPGPGWVVILVGLNKIKPDNALVRWLRKKIPGIPEDGSVPKKYLVVVGLFFVASTIFGIFYGAEVTQWSLELVGLR
ncbi:MAG: PGPGW domain-containing protein [Acidimicrobiales bacterium]